MTTFDSREQGFEAKFAYDEELKFKAIARRNRMLGAWAAERLGLSGAAAVAYANDLVASELEALDSDATLRRVEKDLAPKGVSPQEIQQQMAEYLRLALEQIESGQ
jgi:hypothetical protein